MTWKTSPHLTLTGSLDQRGVSLPVENGDFTTTIYGLDLKAALNRKLFANALIQYDNDSEELQANIRIDWIHTPGSDLFVVFNTVVFRRRAIGPPRGAVGEPHGSRQADLPEGLLRTGVLHQQRVGDDLHEARPRMSESASKGVVQLVILQKWK